MIPVGRRPGQTPQEWREDFLERERDRGCDCVPDVVTGNVALAIMASDGLTPSPGYEAPELWQCAVHGQRCHLTRVGRAMWN